MYRFLILFLISSIFFGIAYANVEKVPAQALRFSFQSADGMVTSKDLRGQVVLLYFGYTNCPDACPTTLQQWTRAFNKLAPDEVKRVKGLMVSVDPERDSVHRLKAFVNFFHKNIIGVTETPENLRNITQQFGTTFKIQKHERGKGYSVDHSFQVYLIDADGMLRTQVDFTLAVDDLVKLLRERLTFTPP